MKKRIIIVDNEPFMSSLIKEFVSESEDFEVSMIASDQESFFNSILQSSFDIALIDIRVSHKEDGLEILKSLKDKNIKLHTIVLSAHDENYYALKCLRLGARGYINKTSIISDLMQGLKKVLEGELFISGSRANSILETYRAELS